MEESYCETEAGLVIGRQVGRLITQAARCDLDDGPPTPPDGFPESARSSAEHRKNCT